MISASGNVGLQPLGRRAAELVAVGDDDGEAVELDRGDGGEPGPDFQAVGVAVDRRDRRDGLELVENRRRADVARVQDVIDLAEYLEHLGAEQAVRVRDDADPRHQPSSPVQRRAIVMSRSSWSSTRCTMKSTSSATVVGRW